MLNTTKYDEKLKPLFEAVKKGDYVFTERWVKEGKPLFNPESKTRSVLYYAVTMEFFSILEVLLSEDWSPYENPLNKALYESLIRGNADFVMLLLDNGASPNNDNCSWYEIVASKDEKIMSAFLEHGKDVDDLTDALGNVEVGVSRALKRYLQIRPEIEEPILKKMVDIQNDIYYLECRLLGKEHNDENESDEEKKLKHLKRVFGLLRWTGVNPRRRVSFYDEEVSVLEYAIEYGSASDIKALGAMESDIETITKVARQMSFCDAKKLKYLQSLGLILNDRMDGSSSFIAGAIEHHNYEVLKLLLEFGAIPRSTDISDENMKSIRYYLFHSNLVPGVFQCLAQVLTQEQMRWVLRGKKTEELFGDKPEVMIKNLYDPKNSDSPLLFDEQMKALQNELKNMELHKVVRQFQQYCNKADKKEEYYHLPEFMRKNTMRYEFSALQCSKSIRPWILSILNRLVPMCEEKGARFVFEEQRYQWCNDLTHVEFVAVIDKYHIPLEFHERTCHVKSYLVLSDGKSEDHTGTLQFCHRLNGNKNKMLEEKHRMDFDDKIDKLCEKLFHVVELEKAHERSIAETKAYWEAERIKREEEEKQRKEELQQRIKRINNNKETFKAMLHKEEDFHSQLVQNAKWLEETRIVQTYIDEVRKRWTAEGPLSEERNEWLRKAELMLAYHNPFCEKKPKMLRDVTIPDSLWEDSWENIAKYIRKWLEGE